MNYPTIQSNGQRIYKAHLEGASPPPRGSEIFVGNLPRDLLEQDLIPLFSQVGPIWELRLMVDFCEQNRGFCFVKYLNEEDANEAVRVFNQKTVTSDAHSSVITVHISVDNRRLFFGRIPREKTNAQLKNDLEGVVDGVINVIIYPETRAGPSGRNRGYAFVEFETHAAAAIARRNLRSAMANLDLYGDEIFIDWSNPEPIVEPKDLETATTLFLKNLEANWSPRRFRQDISQFLSSFELHKIYKQKNYAFLHFARREDAKAAMRLFKEKSSFAFGEFGKQLEVEWARPPRYSKENRGSEPRNNFCLSVPSNVRKLVYKAKSNGDGLFRNTNRCNDDDSSDTTATLSSPGTSVDSSPNSTGNNGNAETFKIRFGSLRLGG